VGTLDASAMIRERRDEASLVTRLSAALFPPTLFLLYFFSLFRKPGCKSEKFAFTLNYPSSVYRNSEGRELSYISERCERVNERPLGEGVQSKGRIPGRLSGGN